jgi:CrcB protein
MIKEILLVGLGGGIGSILRYVSTVCSDKLFHTAFPVGTFLVNLLGCFLMGLLIGLAEHRQVLEVHHRLLFVTGFCGGFTTFSAFSAESLAMFESGNIIGGGVYVAASVLTGLFAVWLGVLLLKQVC